ncbi:DNA-binding response regulator [Peptostreptococcaceae bacterium oral taxon 929]|uniref:response regulator transcription factor n=1 Tax=Fenollaria massiliensis TaxID=938288 RepID=UPI00036E1F49|nr:response regulator transcription factor [Fenollaria massiliensis]AVM66784.1 DNA-binding response regulator [Peptostreptococcaceae bacterium oral taxon 929]OFK81286.1 DNA-binding response regulator [Anaerosphaera sp. HMSC064C01]
MQKILLIDSDETFVQGLKYSLEQDEYLIDTAYSAEEAQKLLKPNEYNLIIMEIDLPDKSGLNLCQDIRRDSNVGIIISTNNKEEIKKILALEYGADDFLVKPYNILELKARMKSLFRRVQGASDDSKNSILEFNHFTINTIGRKLFKDGVEISLTGKEFDLLYILASNKEVVFSRKDLLEKVWGYQFYGDERTVDVHVRRLRNKIEESSKRPKFLKTKWGVGYYFVD